MNKRFEDFNKQDLEQLRKEIVLNSLYISDYNNSFNIDPHSVCDFFDGFISYMEELASEINPNITIGWKVGEVGQNWNTIGGESW